MFEEGKSIVENYVGNGEKYDLNKEYIYGGPLAYIEAFTDKGIDVDAYSKYLFLSSLDGASIPFEEIETGLTIAVQEGARLRQITDDAIREVDELNGETTIVKKQSRDEIVFKGIDRFTKEMEQDPKYQAIHKVVADKIAELKPEPDTKQPTK